MIKISFLIYLIVLVSLCIPVSADEAIVQKLEIENPRNFAYHIGDSFTRSIQLQLRKPYKLKTGLLPDRKRMGRWILLISSEYKEKEFEVYTQYKIDLHYQIINIIPEIKEVILPRHYLIYTDSSLLSFDETLKNPSRLEIPPERIGVSSITNSGSNNIQPDKRPVLLEQSNNKIILYVCLLLAIIAGLAILWWGLPLTKKEQPFSEALLSLKRLKRKSWNDAYYEKALKITHQAFNVTAGKTVFAEKLTWFFNEYKQFEPLKAEIESFFHDSSQHFFKGNDLSVKKKNKFIELIGFIEDCRKIEQGRV